MAQEILIDKQIVKKLKSKILNECKSNLRTKYYNDITLVNRIRKIIEEEVNVN